MSSPPARQRQTRQQIAAAATRAEILQAARQLFSERGYGATSVADLAEAAGVSVPTIYASIGQKRDIASALFGLVAAEIGASEARPQATAARDPRDLLRIAAHINREFAQRFGDLDLALRSAAAAEPEVAALVAKGERAHRAGARRAARRLVELRALGPGVEPNEAADVISFLADPQTYARLVRDHGWTFDRAEVWVAAALEALLLRG